MAVLRQDSSIQEYDLTENEILSAQLLSGIQIMYLQTKYALYFKQKALTMIPINSIDDRDFLLSMGKLEGKLEVLQEMFEECAAAKQKLVTQASQPSANPEQETEIKELGSPESRASALVHQVT